MKGKCFIDTTVILKIILEGLRRQVDFLWKQSKYTLCTPANVLEEFALQLWSVQFLNSSSSRKRVSTRSKKSSKRDW